MKIVIVTQARVGSTRFPEKVLKPILDTTLLGLHLQRLKQSKRANMIFVATTFEEGVEQIINIAKKHEVGFSQGSTTDVLDRFYRTVKEHEPDYVVRVTSDCPLIDPQLIDSIIDFAIESKVDYVSNMLEETFPDGQDIEVVTFDSLHKAWKDAKLPSEREHVTPYIRNNSDYNTGNLFKSKGFPGTVDYNHIRMTVDEEQDYHAVLTLVTELGINADWKSYTNFIIDNPEQFTNQSITRNEGYQKSLNRDHE